MTQLQARYPTASLTADLLTIHQNHYVIRAAVHLGSTTLSTGMAAEADIEQAEDRAKVRALSALGIGSFPSFVPSQTSDYTLPAPAFPTPTDRAPLESGASAAPPLASFSALPNRQPFTHPPDRSLNLAENAELPTANVVQVEPSPLLPIDLPDSSAAASVDFDYTASYETTNDAPVEDAIEPSFAPLTPPLAESSSPVEPIEPLPFSELPPEEDQPKPPAGGSKASTAGKSKAKRKADSPDSPEAPQPSAEADRSEEIAKIGLEMKRLGWTTEQGRNYLKRTYGKRSRQELDDSELMDFLRYLEFQPSPSESPF
jgi:hypothetical protein